MKKLIIAICVISIFSSCHGPKPLQRRLNQYRYPIGYLHDSPKCSEKLDISISPDIIDNSDSTFLTRVNKDDGHFLYLVFLYNYEYDYTISLGRNSIKPTLANFIKESFVKESERSGVFKINDTTASEKYNVLIEILDYSVRTKYYENGNSLGNYSQWHVDVEPSKGNLVLKLSVFDMENNIFLTREYETNQSSRFIKSSAISAAEVNRDMMQNMIEALELCIKENISEIVKDINATLRQ